MIFKADTAIAVELIALVAGTALLMWSCKEGVACRAFGKVVAYITIALSILALLSTGYYTLRYWEDGYFKSPTGMIKHGRYGPGRRGPGRRGPKAKKIRKQRGEGPGRRGPTMTSPSKQEGSENIIQNKPAY